MPPTSKEEGSRKDTIFVHANPCWIAENPKRIGQRFNSSRAHQSEFALFCEMRRVAFRGDVDSFGN